jgi:hypothetical protein
VASRPLTSCPSAIAGETPDTWNLNSRSHGTPAGGNSKEDAQWNVVDNDCRQEANQRRGRVDRELHYVLRRDAPSLCLEGPFAFLAMAERVATASACPRPPRAASADAAVPLPRSSGSRPPGASLSNHRTARDRRPGSFCAADTAIFKNQTTHGSDPETHTTPPHGYETAFAFRGSRGCGRRRGRVNGGRSGAYALMPATLSVVAR